MTSRWNPVVLLLGGWLGAASAQGLPVGIPASTDDWGCEVLLCLANPNGPEAVAPCVPPIERLWSELAKGHAFPTCAMARGPGGQSYAQPMDRTYDPCPAGTTALLDGQLAMLAGPMSTATLPRAPSGALTSYAAGASGAVYTGIGDGENYAGWTQDGGPPPAKTCVAGSLGTQPVSVDGGYVTVDVYQTLVVASPHGLGRVIDVYVDNRWWQSVHW